MHPGIVGLVWRVSRRRKWREMVDERGGKDRTRETGTGGGRERWKRERALKLRECAGDRWTVYSKCKRGCEKGGWK